MAFIHAMRILGIKRLKQQLKAAHFESLGAYYPKTFETILFFPDFLA